MTKYTKKQEITAYSKVQNKLIELSSLNEALTYDLLDKDFKATFFFFFFFIIFFFNFILFLNFT